MASAEAYTVQSLFGKDIFCWHAKIIEFCQSFVLAVDIFSISKSN